MLTHVSRSSLVFAQPHASLFDNYASALLLILENNYGATLLHYLDDFLLVGPPEQPTCQKSMTTMMQLCERLGVPVATEKCEGPATCITFLSIVLDSSLQQLRLPPEKLQEISFLVMAWSTQSHQERTAFSHRKAFICSKGSSSRAPIPS